MKQVTSQKAEITIQTLFFILMLFLMVAIIGYGIDKLVFVQKTLDQTQLQDIKDTLEKTLQYCDDPINRGTKQLNVINVNQFDKVCILGDNFDSTDANSYGNYVFLGSSEFDTLKQGGKNVVLLDDNNQVVGDFGISLYSGISQTTCYLSNGTNKIEVSLVCK